MTRAPFQVLVFPYRRLDENKFEYALFRRTDAGYWQGIAGGGEDDELPIATARREANEEAGIPISAPFCRLDTTASIPVIVFKDHKQWDDELFVIPEFCYGVEHNGPICISPEHIETEWFPFGECQKLLHWDSNKTALWELNERLMVGKLIPNNEEVL